MGQWLINSNYPLLKYTLCFRFQPWNHLQEMYRNLIILAINNWKRLFTSTNKSDGLLGDFKRWTADIAGVMPETEVTWKDITVIQKHYLNFNLENKVGFNGGEIVKDSSSKEEESKWIRGKRHLTHATKVWDT